MGRINVITRPAFFSMGMQIKLYSLSVALMRKYGLITRLFSLEIYIANLYALNSKHIAFDWLKLEYVVYYNELFYQHLVFKFIYGIC